MPAQPAFNPAHPPQFPALYLYPLNESFVPKNISLVGGTRIKIGRQTNAKTVPGERNGYFDSKVLSRQHAEVWEEAGKIFIKDVKSSNGTFINGERLSPEGVESEPFELKTDDIVEFGIDIVGEDNKTIIHHKVAARVTCIFNNDDALSAQREAQLFQQNQSSMNGSAGQLNNGPPRRQMQPQTNGLGVMGGLGGGTRQPGRSGLTFEHIMNRLQGELQKSRETGAELGQVAGAMGEIENVLTGGQPPNVPPYPHLPPVRPPPQNAPSQQQQEPESSSISLQQLQTQLSDTQDSISSHVEKIRTLETLLSDHENIKREVNALRELIEEQRELHRHRVQHIQDEDEDDDRHSIHTITPHELESVPEEDESELEESEEERSARREELGRPRTPEPSSLGMREEDEEHDHRMVPPQPPGIPDETTRRLALLSDQLEAALEMSRNLQSQHAAAQQTIETLESKVNALEELVRATQAAKAEEDAKVAREVEQRSQAQQSDMTSMFAEFRKTIEERMSSVKSDLDTERERNEKARGDWNSRMRSLEESFATSAGKYEVGLTGLATQLASMKANGYVKVVKHKGGLVTPPSPRSLSDDDGDDSDSDQPMKSGVKVQRRRSRSNSGVRARRVRTSRSSRSRSPATSTSATLVDGISNAGSGPGTDSSVASLHSRRSSSDSPVAPIVTDVESRSEKRKHPQFPPTPASSIHMDDTAVAPAKGMQQGQAVSNAQVAMGVFVLGFAAGAVLWRVKE